MKPTRSSSRSGAGRPPSTRARTLPWSRAAQALGAACLLLAAAQSAVRAQEVRILSLAENGLLTWSNATVGVTAQVQWASSPAGPWQTSWESLTNILVTNSVTTWPVPRFFRVVCSEPAAPVLTNITAAAALQLVVAGAQDPGFAVLDVRTPGEFGPRHVKGAINLDFYASDFDARLAALDRSRRYLVYCASGSRSRRAAESMGNLGFLAVFNMTSGFSTLATVPGAAAWLEP
jgi:rhodanese-related sulfurtransferase